MIVGMRMQLFALASSVFALAAAVNTAGPASLYDIKTQTLLGKPADLGDFRGKVTLVVNVASYCGYTPQYKGLEALQDRKSTRLNSSHSSISYAVFCLKKKKKNQISYRHNSTTILNFIRSHTHASQTQR